MGPHFLLFPQSLDLWPTPTILLLGTLQRDSLRQQNGLPMAQLPKDLPPWPVLPHYRTWKRNGLLPQIHDHLRELVRLESGKKSKPTAAILDSQTIKSSESSGERGFDAGKKINGRKRHLLVDTMG